MATYAYVDVNLTLIENTTMQKFLVDGVEKTYVIEPNEGYVLHDANYDIPELDENNEPTGNFIPGYRTSRASVPVTYDFTTNPRQFYAVGETETKQKN